MRYQDRITDGDDGRPHGHYCCAGSNNGSPDDGCSDSDENGRSYGHNHGAGSDDSGGHWQSGQG
jgi:hypothetical protein